MQKIIRVIAIPMLGLAFAAIGMVQDVPVTLKVGSPAPPLKINTWIKGKPVAQLGNGKVNVVEFWATWCGPCKVSIPHLTELAHKYKGKATFTGVSVWEHHAPTDASFLKNVSGFVKDMGDKMDYNVAADGLQSTMANTWMAAAGQDGIPTAFVVDQKGKIVWIGHPMDNLDETVGKVIDGTFDAKAEADAKEKKLAQQKQLQADAGPFEAAARSGKMDVAVKELDKLMLKHPEASEVLAGAKWSILLRSNETGAYAYAKELAAGQFKDNAQMLNQIAWEIVGGDIKLAHPDYALAVTIAKQAADLSKMKDSMILDTYAYALYKKGDSGEAVTVETKAVSIASATGSNVDAATLKEIKDHLEMMKTKPAK